MDCIHFDSNVCVGKRGLKRKLALRKIKDVLAVMDPCSVSAALVYSGWSKNDAPRYGNERLGNEQRKSDRLYGCYTVLPETCGDFFDPDGMVRDMKSKNMVAAEIFPASHHYAGDQGGMGGYFEAEAQNDIPLLADVKELGFDQVARI